MRLWRHGSTALVGALILGAALAGPSPAGAASAPPPASRLTNTIRTDHVLSLDFAVPAVYFSPSGTDVIRLTRGYTPAASPTAGYAVPDLGKGHTAQAGPIPPLTADTVYTFAVWIRANGVYSARRTLTTRTLKDVTPPGNVSAVESRAALARTGRVVLTWQNALGDDLDYVRIVRNTAPTTTGGTVINAPAAAQAWVDDQLPASMAPTVHGFSTSPVYYWLLAHDRAGHFSKNYIGTKVVLGSRTISGRIIDTSRNLDLLCCANDAGVAQGELFISHPAGVTGGTAFSVHVPPGVYLAASSFDPGDGRLTGWECWDPTPPPGAPQTCDPAHFPAANLDLTTTAAVTGLHF